MRHTRPGKGSTVKMKRPQALPWKPTSVSLVKVLKTSIEQGTQAHGDRSPRPCMNCAADQMSKVIGESTQNSLKDGDSDVLSVPMASAFW